MARSGINEILPGLLYQRGQILTWTREVKNRWLAERRIALVVNFWPKVDPDLVDAPLAVGYLYLPARRSEQMLESRMALSARYVASLIQAGHPTLVLCEAGVTRSVFFTVLIVREVNGVSMPEALEIVREKVPSLRLKEFMLKHIAHNDPRALLGSSSSAAP